MSQRNNRNLQEESQVRQNQEEHRAAVKMASKQQQHKVQNPEFLSQLQEADLDTDLHDWVEDEIGILASGSNMKGVRGEDYSFQQDLLVKNAIERVIAEGSPGRLLRENPRMYAQAQGIQATKSCPDPCEHPDYIEPITSQQRRALRQAKEAIVNHRSLSIEGRGIDAVANATVERRSVKQNESEASGLAARAQGLLR
jgi:hypothetical protein